MFNEKTTQILARLSSLKVVPVLVLDTVEIGMKMCELLMENGLPAAEITFRTAAAEETIRRAAKEFPELTLGAGTVLSRDVLHKAIDAGASFAVAPGFNPVVVQEAINCDFPFVPGIATPSELEQAHELGCTFLKFFPAEANGGVKMLKNLLAPYRQLGVRFMPTGGVTPALLSSYLEVPEIACVGGTWLAKGADLKAAAASGDWSPIAKGITDVVETIKNLQK
jgi:2-dehydro-3-deoxyphosphogluconate aldolase / (4S)-4-hydroxy-2-oxoglutarate aldolase